MFYYAESIIPNQIQSSKIEVDETKTRIKVERVKVSRPFHFTPPEEDLSDENPKIKKKSSDKMKEKNNNQKTKETTNKEKKDDEAFFSDANFIIDPLEEETIEKKSNLSLKIRNSKTESPSSKITVLVEDVKNEKFKFPISVDPKMRGTEFIWKVIEECREFRIVLPDHNPESYDLRAMDKTGSLFSVPPFDKEMTLKYYSVSLMALEYNGRKIKEPVHDEFQFHEVYRPPLNGSKAFLDDIRLTVYLPNSRYPQIVPVSPDILLTSLHKLLCSKFKLDLQKHTIQVQERGLMKSIQKKNMEKTLRSLNYNIMAIVRVGENWRETQRESDEWIMDFKDTQSEEIVFPGSVDEIPATEYRVIKVNKYGTAQERVLGINGVHITNKEAKESFSLFRKGTKHPVRLVKNLITVLESDTNEKQFTLVFSKESSRDTETLNLEAFTKIEATEICKKLKYLIDFYLHLGRLQKSENKRRSIYALDANPNRVSISEK